MKSGTKDYLIKRLTSYWKLEAGSVILMPAALLFVVDFNVSKWTLISFIPVMLLLGIGGAYWRLKLHQLQGKGEAFLATMAWIRRLKFPALMLTLIGVGLCVVLWTRPELSKGRPDRIAITFMAVLAVLEYVNYYHRQLNYFDNKADLKRVFSGKGFQPSQMRRDLDQIARRK